MENTITINQLDNFEMLKHCIIEVSLDKLNSNSEILDSILEYLYFDLKMSELEKYITDDGNFEIDFTMMNTICMTYRLNVKVSSSFFNFEINPPSETPISKHYKFPEVGEDTKSINILGIKISDDSVFFENEDGITSYMKDSPKWKEMSSRLEDWESGYLDKVYDDLNDEIDEIRMDLKV